MRLCDGMGRCNENERERETEKNTRQNEIKKLFQLNKNANTPKKHGILNKTTFAFYFNRFIMAFHATIYHFRIVRLYIYLLHPSIISFQLMWDRCA